MPSAADSYPLAPQIYVTTGNMNNVDQDDPCIPASIAIPQPPSPVSSTSQNPLPNSTYLPVLASVSRRRAQSWEGTPSPPQRSFSSPVIPVLQAAKKPRWDAKPSNNITTTIPNISNKTKRVSYHHTFLILVSALILLFLARLDVPEDISMKYADNAATTNTDMKGRHAAIGIDAAPSRKKYTKRNSTQQGISHDHGDFFQLAIFLQVSTTSLPLLARLLSQLHHEDNMYIVHFDTEINPEEGLHQLRLANVSRTGTWDVPDNVHILPQETVNYRGISMTLNTISGMTYALEHSKNWRYFINLSGSDYPLISPAELRNMLLGHPGTSREFFSFAPDEAAERMMKVRLRNFHVDSALGFLTEKNKVVSTGIENPLGDKLQLIPAFAEAWMICSREFIAHITHSSDARRALLTFAYSVSSPEHYFASLVLNSKFSAAIVNHSMRLVKWRYRGERAGQHPYYLDELYQREIEAGRKSQAYHDLVESPLFFARKFKHNESKLMDDIDGMRNDAEHIKVVRDHFYGKLNYKNINNNNNNNKKTKMQLESNAVKSTNGHGNNS